MEDTGASGTEPGQTVTPTPTVDQKEPESKKSQEQPSAEPAAAPKAPAEQPSASEQVPPSEAPAAADVTPAGGFFRPETAGGGTPDDSPEGSADELAADDRAITWTASEFIAHAKSFSWYTALGAGAAALAALVFLMTKDPVSVGVILVA